MDKNNVNQEPAQAVESDQAHMDMESLEKVTGGVSVDHLQKALDDVGKRMGSTIEIAGDAKGKGGSLWSG